VALPSVRHRGLTFECSIPAGARSEDHEADKSPAVSPSKAKKAKKEKSEANQVSDTKKEENVVKKEKKKRKSQ
jgi:hypothetical protein